MCVSGHVSPKCVRPKRERAREKARARVDASEITCTRMSESMHEREQKATCKYISDIFFKKQENST